MANNNLVQFCAICGEAPATTRDHVPPKGIFPKPRPSLVTVPACFRCNHGGARHDEAFRVYLNLHVGTSTAKSKELLEKHTLRTLSRSRRLRREIQDNSEPLVFSTPTGFIWGVGRKVRWNSQAHDAVVERTIRGLFFHHFAEILGDRVTLKVQWLYGFPPDIVDSLKNCPVISIGDGQFVYTYGRAQDQALTSVWLLCFHGKHFASGYTLPRESN